MPKPCEDIHTAKRKLGRTLRSHDGFVGVGVKAAHIRLYAQSERAPVVRYFRSRYGDTYHGYDVSIVPSSGFSPTTAESPP